MRRLQGSRCRDGAEVQPAAATRPERPAQALTTAFALHLVAMLLGSPTSLPARHRGHRPVLKEQGLELTFRGQPC